MNVHGCYLTLDSQHIFCYPISFSELLILNNTLLESWTSWTRIDYFEQYIWFWYYIIINASLEPLIYESIKHRFNRKNCPILKKYFFYRNKIMLPIKNKKFLLPMVMQTSLVKVLLRFYGGTIDLIVQYQLCIKRSLAFFPQKRKTNKSTFLTFSTEQKKIAIEKSEIFQR